MNVIKFVTKTVSYTVKNNKVIQARSIETGRFVARSIAQKIHDKMVNAVENFKSFVNVNKAKAQVLQLQVASYFKKLGYKVSCVIDGKSRLTMNTFLSN